MARDVRIEYLTKGLADEIQPLVAELRQRGWPIIDKRLDEKDGKVTLSIVVQIWPVVEQADADN